MDEIIVTVTPFILGGKDAISIVEGRGFDKVSQAYDLKLKKVHRIQNELVLHYAN